MIAVCDMGPMHYLVLIGCDHIETPKHDVDLIKQRYAEAKEQARHEK